MALFEFELKSFDKIVPFGDEQDRHLHWYGLTDSFFYMNVGDAQLFRYSNDIIKTMSREPLFDLKRTPFADYYVARLYEDILDILVDVLDPIPQALYNFTMTPKNTNQWLDSLHDIFDGTEDKNIEELYFKAIKWRDHRKIGCGYLSHAPTIHIYRFEDDVYLHWEGGLTNEEGTPYFTTSKGNFKISVQSFLDEVKSFHFRLMLAMENMIHNIKDKNLYPHIKIDVPSLLKEHQERKLSLEKSLNRLPSIKDWSEIVKANKKLLNLS